MSPAELTARSMKAGLLIGLLVFAIAFGVVVEGRIAAPFDLEWMEGLVIDSAIRLSLGQTIYPPPNADFMASVYPPIYPILVADLFNVFGPSYLTARIVSLVSTFVIIGTLYLLVARTNDSKYWALVAAGLFLAAFRFTGAWYDLARVDILALALILLAAYLALCKGTLRAAGVVGALIFCAVSTKQTTGLFIPAFIVLYAMQSRVAAAVFTGVTLGLITLSLIFAHMLTDGGSTYYMVQLPMSQPATLELSWLFWRQDMLKGIPFLLGMFLLFVFVIHMIRKENLNTSLMMILLLAILGLTAAWLPRSRIGGYDNVLMMGITPLVLLACVAGGLLEAKVAAARPRLLPYLQVILSLLVIGQLALWVYPPAEQIPKKGDYSDDQRLRAYLGTLEGRIYSPHRGFLIQGPRGPASVHQYLIVDVSLDKITVWGSLKNWPDDCKMVTIVSFCWTKDGRSGNSISTSHATMWSLLTTASESKALLPEPVSTSS